VNFLSPSLHTALKQAITASINILSNSTYTVVLPLNGVAEQALLNISRILIIAVTFSFCHGPASFVFELQGDTEMEMWEKVILI
jgi:hypothetical protein